MKRTHHRRLARRAQVRPDPVRAMIADLDHCAGSVEEMVGVITDVVHEGRMPAEIAAAMVPNLMRIAKASGSLVELLQGVVTAEVSPRG